MTDFFAHLETAPGFTAEEVPAFDAAADALRFITAGDATFTLQSLKTNARFTFRVKYPRDRETGKVERGDFQFVSVLTGPENTTDYAYLGYIRRGVYFHGGAKAKVGRDALSAKAFDWVYANLAKGVLPEQLRIFHAGRCGRCNRLLTVPESIKSGFGPECAGRL